MNLSSDEVSELENLGLDNILYHRAALGTLPNDFPEAPQPIGWKVVLFKHQLMASRAMKDFENYTPNISHTSMGFTAKSRNAGVIMEPVGAGKSYIVLSRIAEQPSLTRSIITFKHEDIMGVNPEINLRVESHCLSGSINLIVVPHGIVSQWVEYLKNTSLTYAAIRTRNEVVQSTNKKDCMVWLVSSTMYTRLIMMHPRLTVSRLIIDECDSISIPNMNAISFVYCWFISSSAQNILYPNGTRYRGTYSSGIQSHGFITKALSRMGSIPDIIIKTPYLITRQCMNLPEPNINTILVRRTNVLNVLDGFMKSKVHSLINADDMVGLANYLNIDTVESDSDIIDHVLEQYKTKLTRLEELRGNILPTNVDEIKRADAKIVEHTTAVQIIRERLSNQDTCMICFRTTTGSDIIDNLTITPCCHSSWCLACIINSLSYNERCPKCRTIINQSQLTSVVTGQPCNDNLYKDKSTAFLSLIQTICQNNQVPKRI